MKILVRLLNAALFLAAWIGAFMILHWASMKLLETRDFSQGIPAGFSVVVETHADGAAPTYESRPFRKQAEFKLEPGESLHLSAAAYDQMDHEPGGSCCIAFKVLEDTAGGQLIELNDDDTSYVLSRYRVREGQVQPVAHRAHFVLYYVGYLVLGGFLAWLLTRPLRRRSLAWARARSALPPPIPG
jgi:hypothetical protein